MPPRPRRVDLPTFYLDTSTLCDAVRAHFVGAGGVAALAHAAYKPLLPWLERVASEANLCVALVHLLELARWQDRASATAVAQWLDGLETVWVRQMVDVQEDEDEHWLRIALGLPQPQKVNAFAPSMLLAIGQLTPTTSPDALVFSRLPELVDLLGAVAHSSPRDDVRAMVQRFHDDRRWAADTGWTEERKRNERAYRQRVEIRTRAHEALRRIERRGEKIPSQNQDGTHAQDLLVELIGQTPSAMPSFRLVDDFSMAWGDLAGRQTPGSNRASGMESTFEDFLHLAVGAAYCDVFTCDADVSGCLGDARIKLGLARQLSVREVGGPAAFVKALMATWS